MTQNNYDDFDIEANRKQWEQEREERRVEENELATQKTAKFMPIYTIIICYCFLSIVFTNRDVILEDALYYINQSDRFLYTLLLAAWFGAIGDITRLAIHKHKPLLKFCIAIIFCAILSIGTMMFSFTQLPNSTVNTVFMLSKAFALAGAICTLYPIKYAWTNKLK